MNIPSRYMRQPVILLAFAAAPLFGQTPSVVIDGPTQGANVSGTVTVSGWAMDNTSAPGTAIGTVIVQVDGVNAGVATMGISRNDVCTAYPGRPGCPNVGYAYSLNANALTPGNHVITVLATDTDPIPDTGSASVTVTVGPPPSVAIDSPTAGSVVTGVINVTGWALDNTSVVGTAISGVQVSVDGVSAGNATYGVNRTDVCNAYPGRPNCPNVGYTFALNTASYAQGTHVITVTAVDSDGQPDFGSASTTVTTTVPPTVMIDSMTPGTVVSGVITISGWAIDNSTSVGTVISSVQILVDGAVAGNATYGASRLDVCNSYPGRPGCPNVGFTFQLDTSKLTPGAHSVTAVATDSDPTADKGSWTINITVGNPPAVRIESPVSGANVTGQVTLSGWALDNVVSVGTAISSLQVSVDGGTPSPIFYGLSRPDVCLVYPGRPGCPNVGFSYAFDTSALSAGSHTVTVTATNSSNPPISSSSSVTISVAGGVPASNFSLTSPNNGSVVSGTVMVTGWAFDPKGAQMNAIKVYMDGIQQGLANYGIPTTINCTGYPASTGCPDVGFSFSLDTSSLSTGSHTIFVAASTEDGAPPVGMGTVVVMVTH
jgi:N-acetylmuramoyl-L-alanine amidase